MNDYEPDGYKPKSNWLGGYERYDGYNDDARGKYYTGYDDAIKDIEEGVIRVKAKTKPKSEIERELAHKIAVLEEDQKEIMKQQKELKKSREELDKEKEELKHQLADLEEEKKRLELEKAQLTERLKRVEELEFKHSDIAQLLG